MYGFGDDRNPANDTINVMEEILVEYIADVVRITGVCFHRSLLTLILFNISVRLLRDQAVKTDFRLRTCEKLFLVLRMQKSLLVWKNSYSLKKILSGQGSSSKQTQKWHSTYQ